jgi:hypothetical protein
MAGQTEKKEDNRRRYYWDWDYDSRDKKKDTIQGFGVEADTDSNQLLLWATDVELERVNELLVELGEIPTGQRDARTVRFIEPTDAKRSAELLKQLQEAWKASGGGELIINTPASPKPAPAEQKQEKKEEPTTDKAEQPAKDRSAGAGNGPRIAARFVELAAAVNAPDAAAKADDAAPAPAAPPANQPAPPIAQPSQQQQPAPVTVTVTPDGRLMLSSSDPAALDRLEELVERLSPPERRFKVYPLQYISALDMYLTLKNYFKEDLETDDKGSDFSDWWWGYRPRSSEDKGATGLAKRRKLLFDWDPSSNSVIVANASPSQIAEAEQLILEFDKRPRDDSVEKRTTKAIKVKYSRPTVIAAAIKEVYRDLLSSRDKEFDRGGDQKDKRASAERVTVINYGGSSGGDDDRSSSVKLGFDGALSLGADDVSGVLIVSAQQGIFNDIERMVLELDNQAAPTTTVHVHHVNGIVSAESLQKALDKAVGTAWLGNRPEQQPNQTGPDGEKKNAERERRSRSNRQDGENRE